MLDTDVRKFEPLRSSGRKTSSFASQGSTHRLHSDLHLTKLELTSGLVILTRAKRVRQSKNVVQLPLEARRILQGYLAPTKHPPPGNPQKDFIWGPMVVLRGWAFSYGRGTPVASRRTTAKGSFRNGQTECENALLQGPGLWT